MPCTITLTDVSWSTPDGRQLFSRVNLGFGLERTGLVGRNGVGKTTLLKLIAGHLTPSSGVISSGGRIYVLRQALQVHPHETVADLFDARAPLAALSRAQAGEASLEELSDLDWTLEASIITSLMRMGVSVSLDLPLERLSGGQRTRVALAASMHANPDFLLLDEPTNNLDREGKALVIDFLAGWQGGAVIVSHDRELLEAVDAIVEVSTLGVTRYGGNWSDYRKRKALELSAANQDVAEATRRLVEVNRRTQDATERKSRRDAVGERRFARGDLPRIVAGGRKMLAEQSKGKDALLGARMQAQALDDLKAARDRIEILQPFSVQLPSTGLPVSRTVLRLDCVDAGYEAEHPVLRNVCLSIDGPERVAVIGPNGSGKTTLISVITKTLQPLSGTVHVTARCTFLDQQVSLLDPEMSIRDNFLRLNPDSEENGCRAALAQFMFRADSALQRVGSLSGGQMLRAGLACTLGGGKPPQLLILDEPTNHLDIDSIAAVEAGLRAFDGALVVVSHDEAFLEAIGISREFRLPALQ